MYPFASLPENLAAFCETLRRDHGFHIGPGELHEAARALEIVDLADERAVRHVLRPILAGTRDEAMGFDAAFTRFFFPGPAGLRQEGMPSTRRELGTDAGGLDAEAPHTRRATPPTARADETWGPDGGPMMPLEATTDRPEGGAIARSSFSPLDADVVDAPELPRVEPAWRDAARTFVRRLQGGLSRRWRPARRGRRFDIRRTLRASLQTGGETLSPRWMHRPRRAPRIVLFIDGSRSMDAHARTALQMAVAIASATMRMDVFTFSTGLERVTDQVRRSAAGEPCRLERLHYAWAGGTKIGACLRAFLLRFGARMVGRDTVVLIASDGLDVGTTDVLRDAMRELHRRSAGVVWLNPLIETEGYEPTASGMRAARPYATTFASVSDATGLLRLSRTVRLRG